VIEIEATAKKRLIIDKCKEPDLIDILMTARGIQMKKVLK